jgi:predicted acyl esterase
MAVRRRFPPQRRGRGQDCADTINWLADQPWSNGKVGMTGVSYLAAIQFWVAALNPPALAAINRGKASPTGIANSPITAAFSKPASAASDNIRFSLNHTEDTWENAQAHPLMDAFWHSKEIDLAAIRTPAWVVASWSDQGLHTRGTLEAFKAMSSPQKWLDVHGQKKWAHYYLAQSQARREAFFDHFLKDRQTAVAAWPPVRIEVRTARRSGGARRTGWPRPHGADAAVAACRRHAGRGSPDGPATIAYDANEGEAVFDHRFEQDTELTGHASLRLWWRPKGPTTWTCSWRCRSSIAMASRLARLLCVLRRWTGRARLASGQPPRNRPGPKHAAATVPHPRSRTAAGAGRNRAGGHRNLAILHAFSRRRNAGS